MSIENYYFYGGIAIICVLLKYLSTLNFDYFTKRNIPFVKPIPIFGTSFKNVFGLESSADSYTKWCNQFSNSKIFGIFEFLSPVYVVQDPELVKQVLVKDFDCFVNHRNQMDVEIEPGFGRTIFMMRNNRWKQMRSTVSPAFTGAKMRMMFEFVNSCAIRTRTHIEQMITEKTVEINTKDIMARFGTDVIGNSVFGLEINTFKDDNGRFFEMGNRITKMTGIRKLKFLLFIVVPGMMKKLKIRYYDTEILEFFRDTVKSSIDYREKHNVIRPDMMHLLMEAKKGNLKHESKEEKDAGFATVLESDLIKNGQKVETWDDDDLMAQCLIFFFAGYDTISSTLGFLAYHLATNIDVQNRLIDEVDALTHELDSKPLTYNFLQKMKYLDMVMCESMRRSSAVVLINRICNKATTMQVSESQPLQINAGDQFWIPIYSIHNDPKNFPNPEKFDPERFSDANSGNLNNSAYLPFGAGPRNCIGSRFALMEMKAIIYHILTFARFEVGERTQVPMKIAKDSFFLEPEKGFYINIRKRSMV